MEKSLKEIKQLIAQNPKAFESLFSAGATRPYKAYVATILQSGTAAPTATVFENSIGPVSWTRSAAGQYVGTGNAGAFPVGKTVVFVNGTASGTGRVSAAAATANTVTLSSYDNTGANADALLASVPIEIRVYA